MIVFQDNSEEESEKEETIFSFRYNHHRIVELVNSSQEEEIDPISFKCIWRVC